MGVAKVTLNGTTLMDTTGMTVTSSTMVSATTALDKAGEVVTGTIATKTSNDITVNGSTVTVPAGVYNTAITKSVASAAAFAPAVTLASSTGVVTGTNTFTAGYYSASTKTSTLNLTTQAAKTVTPTETAQTAVNSYRWTTGNITVAAISSDYVGTNITRRTSTDLTASGSTVTVPVGYYATQATKNISGGSAFTPAVTITKTPTITLTSTTGIVTATYAGSSQITPTVTAGYIATGGAGTVSTSGTSTFQLTSKAAATYNTSTADQTVASYRWLTGTQTIKSVTTSNLTAGNIKSGVVVKVGDANNASRITQVTGTLSAANLVSGTKSITENGTGIDVTDYAAVDVDVPSGNTVTIHRTGDTSINTPYVQLNGTGTVYRYEGDTFSFSEGDYLSFYIGPSDTDGHIYVNGTQIQQQSGNTYYTYNPKVGNLDITLKGNSNDNRYVYINTPVPQFAVNMQNNGNEQNYIKYNNTKYMTGYTGFIVYAGDKIYINVTQGESNTLVINGVTVAGGYGTAVVDYEYTMPSCNINIRFSSGTGTSSITITEFHNTLEITENGIVDVGNYDQASVSVAGDPLLPVYLSIVNRNTLYASDPLVAEWANTISNVNSTQFAGLSFNGTITFGNVVSISGLGFAGIYSTNYPGQGTAILSFPKCTQISSWAFENNRNLGGIFADQCLRIGDSAFSSCFNLIEISFPSAQCIERWAFVNCSKITTVNFPLVTSLYSNAFGSCTQLISARFPLLTNITGTNTFANCTRLSDISFPNLMSIPIGMFQYCYSLTSAIFPQVIHIGAAAFYLCSSLVTASFPLATDISTSAFYSCSQLKTISFPKVTGIGSNAFYSCASLSQANFPEATYISIGGFMQCPSLSSVNFPKLQQLGSSAFYGCSSLEYAIFSSCTTVGMYAFQSCNALLQARMPLAVHVASYAFNACTKLSLVECAPSFLTSYTFRSCYRLLSLYIFANSVCALSNANVFTSTPISTYTTQTAGERGTIYVPSSLYSQYISATNWTLFSSRIVSM